MRSRSLFEIFPELRHYRAADYARLRVTKPTIAIAMTPRTGSTHLADALARALGTAPRTRSSIPVGRSITPCVVLPLRARSRRKKAAGRLP